MPTSAKLAAIRAQIAALEAGTRSPNRVWRFGVRQVDQCFQHGGLTLGAWHELSGEGLQAELASVTAGFAARLAGALAGKAGEVLWVMRRDDLYPPGLSFGGFAAERLIQVKADSEDEVLAVLEEALATRGIAVAVGEVEEVPLIAGRRLQLACERGGGTGLVIRRRPYGLAVKKSVAEEGSAAASRWRIAPAPGAAGSGGMGLGAARWRVELTNARGGRPGAWTFEEAGDGPHPFRLAADVADHGLAPVSERLRRFG